jgi:hypothetical protein
MLHPARFVKVFQAVCASTEIQDAKTVIENRTPRVPIFFTDLFHT